MSDVIAMAATSETTSEDGALGAMRRLHEVLGYFEEGLDAFGSELRPILRPTNPSPSPADKQPESGRSDHHDTVRSAISRVEHLHVVLSDLRGRVDL
jgi:hypothetical protein